MLSRKIKERFIIDENAFLLFRFFLGALLLWDDLSRFPYLKDFYTSEGVVGNLWGRNILDSSAWSLNLLVDSYTWQVILMLCHMGFSFALMLGFFPAIVAPLLWALMSSRQVANPLAISSGDELLRHMLLWTSFASILPRKNYFRLIGEAPIIIQVMIIYFFSALLKTDPSWSWWRNGTAVQLALRLDSFSTPLGRTLLQYPVLCHLMTHAAWTMELLSPLLVLAGGINSRFRGYVSLLFILFHLSLVFMFRLGYFPLVCMCCWLALLPSPWMNKLKMKLNYLFQFLGNKKIDSISPFIPSRKYFYLLVAGLSVYLNIFTLSVNILSTKTEKFSPPHSMVQLGEIFQIWQQWAMFAPLPSIDDGWNTIVGHLSNSKEIDLSLGGGPIDREASLSGTLTFDKPGDPSLRFKSAAWKRYLFSLHAEGFEEIRKQYLHYLCREWNKKEPNIRLLKVDFGYSLEITVSENEEAKPDFQWLTSIDCP